MWLTLQHLLKMEPIQCSEISVFNTQTPGKYPEDNLSLKILLKLDTNNGILPKDLTRVATSILPKSTATKRIRNESKAKQNNTGNVRTTEKWGAFAWPLLPWKSDEYYAFKVRLSNLSCRACAVLHWHLRSVWLYHFFPPYLMHRTIFVKKEKKSKWAQNGFDFLYGFCQKHLTF